MLHRHVCVMDALYLAEVDNMLKLTHHGNISVHKLHHICTLHIVKMGEIWVSIEMIILKFLHKITCCGYLLESPRGGDSNRYPEHVIVWRNDDI